MAGSEKICGRLPPLQRHGFIKSMPLEGWVAPPPWWWCLSCCFFAFCAVSSGLHHSWYVDKYKRITLRWSYGCDKKVSHPGLHHSGNQVDKLLADVEDKLLAVDNDGDVKGPMSANGNSQVEEHLTVKRKLVAPRNVRQSTQQSTNIKVMCVMLSTGIGSSFDILRTIKSCALCLSHLASLTLGNIALW